MQTSTKTSISRRCDGDANATGGVGGTFRKHLLRPARETTSLTSMCQILEIEDQVAVPPMMYADPFYRITYLIKEEIRKHKWLEGEKGRRLSWTEARAEWTKAHREQYEKFLVETLSFPNLVPATPFAKEANLSTEEAVARIGAALSTLPHRSQ